MEEAEQELQEIIEEFRKSCIQKYIYGRPSPPKIQGCQIDQQIHRWLKDQLQDSIANKRMAWPNYRQSSFP